MVNLVSKIYGAVVAAQLVRWIRTIFAVAINCARSMGSMIKRGGQTLLSADALPLMRQQLVNPAVQLGRQPGEHVLEVGVRVMPGKRPAVAP
jgi:hypothetical protein